MLNSKHSGHEVDEFDRTSTAIAGARAASLLVLPDPVFSAYTARIADLTNKSRLPAMYGLREDAAAGGLLAYGPKYADLYRRAASYVDKLSVPRGARNVLSTI